MHIVENELQLAEGHTIAIASLQRVRFDFVVRFVVKGNAELKKIR